MEFLYVLCFGFLLDLFLGDPHWLPHPVRFIGWMIRFLEEILRELFPKTAQGEFRGGIVLTILVLLISGGIPAMLLWICGLISPILRFVLETWICYQLLAARSLYDESNKVYQALEIPDLTLARDRLSMIVGRDTAALDKPGVTRAAVETVAENTSDGVVAPLFYLALGGPVLGFLYKAVNTMDSMVGYHNEKYENFGKCAATLDDIVNFVPARLSALLMIVAAGLQKLSFQGAIRIWRRDRKKHKSPNSAQTESVCAGALGVQLAGDAYYFGKLHRKPTIGDALRPIEPEDIQRANWLMLLTAFLALFVCGGGMALIRFLVF